MRQALNKREFLALFRASLIIAIIIFVTAIFYDFSVKMYYGSTNSLVQVGSSILAVFVMASVITFFLWWIPDARKAVLRTFGLYEEPKNEKPRLEPSDEK